MRRKRGWEREREGEGGRENLRLDGVSPALSLTLRSNTETTIILLLVAAERSECRPKFIRVHLWFPLFAFYSCRFVPIRGNSCSLWIMVSIKASTR